MYTHTNIYIQDMIFIMFFFIFFYFYLLLSASFADGPFFCSLVILSPNDKAMP